MTEKGKITTFSVDARHLQNITRPFFLRLDMSDSDSGDDWEEVDNFDQTIVCLFCNESFKNFGDALKHLKVVHDFDLASFKQKHTLDEYSFIQLVNFIRKKNALPEDLNLLNTKAWENEEYLIPNNQEDAWLMFGTNRQFCDDNSLLCQKIKSGRIENC